jgi:hypothetical protein
LREVRVNGVSVRGKCALLDEYFVAFAFGPIEARQHQMQIDCERVHCDDFAQACASESCQSWRELFVVRNPGPLGVEVAIHCELGPCRELLVDRARGGLWLQSQRVPAQVDAARSTFARRQMKSIAQRRENIFLVLLLRVGSIERRIHQPLSAMSIGLLGAASEAKGAICKFSK